MRALITGGCGFIGSYLAEALLARGDTVTIVDDLSTGRFENIAHLVGLPGLEYAIETITNEAVMDRLASQCDIIYHLAAAVGVELVVRDPVHVLETNVQGAEVIFRVGARYRKKVVPASTSEVYGKGTRVPFSENDDRTLGPTTRSRWSYACSKALDEFMALAYYRQKSLPVVITRFFNTVGPRQSGRYGMVIPRFVRQALADEPITIYGDGKQSRCFAYVGDVVRAVVALADSPSAVGQVYNIGSTEEVTIEQLARRVITLSGSKSKLTFIPYDQAYEEGFEDMLRRVPDISKVRAAIGWEPVVDLDGILTRVIASMRA
ncbi:MAG: NAD-dependent epimerase/dehydratase family protein [Chloroflexi bacterium]|nr:NAD-dependent epimerase/dehydratase family protein [Chloroflexota bacterium]